jgi:predicted DNA-binding transcriptional regulator YafY
VYTGFDDTFCHANHQKKSVRGKFMRADRLVAIVLLLQARRKVTAQVLAARLEVSPRTILRDVEALSRAGIPIYTNGGRGGGIALDENYFWWKFNRRSMNHAVFVFSMSIITVA